MHHQPTLSHMFTAALFLGISACGSSADQPHASTTTSVPADTATSTPDPIATTRPADMGAGLPDPNAAAPGGGTGLTVTATGFTVHAGQHLFAAIVDANGHRLADTNRMVPADGNLTLTFNDVVLDGNNRLVYYADLNKDGFCNTPPLDHSWSVPINAGEATVSVTYNENFTAVCENFGAFTVSFMGTGFTPHVGQTFYIDIVDNTDKTEVGEAKHMVIPNTGSVAEAWGPVLLAGHSYTVAYFADANKNQTCDNLGTDHAWVKTITNVAADVTVTGKHSDVQMKSVCTNFPLGKLQ